MISTSAELTMAVLHKAIGRYYRELEDYKCKGETELNLRPAFQNLLADMARRVNLTLMHEMTIHGRIRPDGVLFNAYNIRQGYWEAKGPKGNFEAEIEQKKRDGYPLDNALFENTLRAVLYQNGQRQEYDMRVVDDVATLLQRFLQYQKPDVAKFERAVQDFKEQIPNIAQKLLALINEEHTKNTRFQTAFNDFTELCRSTLNSRVSLNEIREMLVQHLLTERLFRTVFNNPDFVRNNVVAAKIEQVIQALTSRTFSRGEFLRALDPFYSAIEGAARGIETWSERQQFLNTVYERFFQGFAVQKADTHGIVYTPQEIVDFMVASVDEVLKREFGQSLATPGVSILDPAVGTGNFIVNVIKRIPRTILQEKYANDLFCNEIMLLPYYIASLNIEHEYYAKMGEYVPFEGVCFVDTLETAESRQMSFLTEENSERVKREKEARIRVIIGNPPYNAWQKSENDNNKNRRYSVINERLQETYVKASRATNKNALSDMYVKFFRWATDRLEGRDGIVCLISNNSFVEQIAFDGMRQHLLRDFTHIYHLDLHGNVRKNPKLSGTTHNVFGIQVGVGITIAVRSSSSPARKLFYYRLPEYWRKKEKLAFLADKGSLSHIDWIELQPDEQQNWFTEHLHPEFTAFIPLGTKEGKIAPEGTARTFFKTYANGVKTNRDNWAYNFNYQELEKRIGQFIDDYNAEVSRWIRASGPKEIDDFVHYEKIKWSRDLKRDLQSGRYAQFNNIAIRNALYRPFSKRWLYHADILVDRLGKSDVFFPLSLTKQENIIICVTGLGADHQTFLASNSMVDIKFGINGNSTIQCFPYYTYAKDGNNRRENITDWALEQFRARYGQDVSKWDIFHYIYAMLHHPQYRERYAENLKRDLPHIPLVSRTEAYQVAVSIGKALMDLHVHYEQQEAYPLTYVEDETVPYAQTMYVEKMKLTPDRTAVVVSRGLILAGIPETCYRYRLGNRSALEWVIDQYQVTKDARSGIINDPNRAEDPEYIVRLVGRVVVVSVKTVQLVEELARAVTQRDWLGKDVEGV